MSTAFRGASMVMGGVESGTPDGLGGDEAASRIADYAAAGIRAFLFPGILLREPKRLLALTCLARRLTAEASAPAMDESLPGRKPVLLALGGWERPAATWPTAPGLPTPLALGATRDRRLARRTGFLFGRLAAACGIDLVFGPNLDLATDPKVEGGIMDRFGEEHALVELLGAALFAGLERGGLAACAGRFPGCGSLVGDGRAGPLILPWTKERLEAAELPPFARMIKAGIRAILVGRVLVPALEGSRIPAARSDLVVEGRLRSSLGFKGMAIGEPLDLCSSRLPDTPPRPADGRVRLPACPGDDIEGSGRAALLGSLAGCDLTICLGKTAALSAADYLDRAGRNGELPHPRIAVAEKRLSLLLEGLGRRKSGGGDGLESGEAEGIVTAPSLIAGHAFNVAEKSATVLRRPAASRKGAARFVGRTEGLFVLAFLPSWGSARAGEAGSASDAARTLGEELPGARVLVVPAEPTDSEGRLVLAALDDLPTGATEALVLTCDAHRLPGQESLVHVLEESLPSVSVISLLDPYDGAFFPKAHALGAVYGCSGSSLRVAARMALGSIEAKGRCPVAVLGLEL